MKKIWHYMWFSTHNGEFRYDAAQIFAGIMVSLIGVSFSVATLIWALKS